MTTQDTRQPAPSPSTPRRRGRGAGALMAGLLAIAGLVGGLVGGGVIDLELAQADEHELPGTLGVFGPRGLGSAVYPKQEIPLSFKHSEHIAAKIPCERCHTDVNQSTKSADNNFPRGVSCDGCHGKQHPRADGAIAQCGLCHTRSEGSRVTATLQAPRP
ncbi:MAG: cytochrome c3 family protein, partial [Myxococcales bacterium]|nr:cytochrome c3 family protein [Myxococcales bacterium]